jgi:hypothetical protein
MDKVHKHNSAEQEIPPDLISDFYVCVCVRAHKLRNFTPFASFYSVLPYLRKFRRLLLFLVSNKYC